MPDRLQLPTPPAEPPAASFPVLASLAPVVGAGALWLVTQLSSMLLFALLGPVIAIASLGDGRMQRRRARRREAARFARDCDALDDRIRAAHADEALAIADAHPDARACAEAPANHPHRWRHAAGQPVPVTLGVGAVASSSALDGYPHRQADDVQRRADALRAHAAEVEAPLVVDARLGIGVVAAPGVGDAHARSLVLQVLAQLSPRDVAVVVEADATWAWIDAVPHRVDRQVVDDGVLVRILGDDLEVTIASGPTAERLPRDCRVVVEARLDGVRVGERSCVPALVSTLEAVAAAARLAEAATHAGIGGAAVLPALVPLADLAQDAPGVLPATFLAAPQPLAIDLAVDGPHAVVGGTTGSGKSELLVAWIAALARRHDPADLAVLLVDFKGGASFEALRELRHCVGVVTDLDEHGATRAIESLRAEIRHRERVLHAQGVRSIEQATGLGRLVIVVDEFAAMLHEQPDLLRLFADVASRGRSLGMHLILCTQRPAEAVRDAVLANCGVRISLRVPDDADAIAVTGVPDAARLRLDERGRCVVRIAGHATVHAQSALAEPALLARLVADSQVHAAPRRPWCDPLPARIPIDALPVAREPGGIVLGLVDRPSSQRVDPLVWRPAVDGPLLALGAAASGKSALVDLLATAGADVVRDEESLWDAVHEPIAPGVLAIDDVDALLARLDDEHAHEVAALLARRMREGAGVGHAVALTARRATAAMGQLAPLADTRVLLRLASRQEHALAGGAMDRYDATMPPGAAWVAGERVQLGIADAMAVPRTPQRVAMPRGPLAIVAATLDDVPRGLGATGKPAAPGDVTIGTVGEWEAAWGALDRLRVDRPVLVLGVDDRVARQVLRGAPLSPVLRGERRWMLVGGVASRLA
ncbi:FtsK/SpoIIIE domain-containing protein [Agrococcus jejuensis]|uniref:DNA segregation ATPase FtsK/SpoIIIE, S-DNA-T family n=1 Tax=Agrococcus jejuensis TaxID=399736 RepID=A0A1G8ASL6_9MICO|nr:FtsK/SpoIIIE domain-containing protein [Agrococcus jejuensis]SDH24062.1 DNA segregation ATPase FtsK/SpoIIIE, S-DNA-T family [Agrococcus jejuensis]